MNQCLVSIISNKQILPDIYLMWLEAPQIASIAKPGQFIMISCDECLLRRPISIHRVNKNGGLAILYSTPGKGTQWLSHQRKSKKLNIFGPLGHGFIINPQSHNLLFLGGGIGIAPLLFLAETALCKKASLTIVQGASTARQLYPERLLPQQIKFLTYTEDGSQAKTKVPTNRGMVTDYVADLALLSDQIFACGPGRMFLNLKNKLEAIRYANSVQISLEIRMGCGLGACYGCSIHTSHGMKKVCQDGPIFELSDFTLDDLEQVKIWP